MDFTARYVPRSLFSFFRMTTRSLSEVRCFTPLESVECSCLLPASVIVNPNVFVGQARSLLMHSDDLVGGASDRGEDVAQEQLP